MATTTPFSTPQSTPRSQILQPLVSTPSPGPWRHPRFDEIARRQRASTFDDSNLRRIAWNGAALATLTLCIFYPQFYSIISNESLRLITTPTLILLSTVFVYNISIALLPLMKVKDNLADIPLTPTQRSLLGLDPNATPPLTPRTQYITPPRYPRSPTPRNLSPSTRSFSGHSTPTSRKGSPLIGREGSDSPSASPLWQKAMGDKRETTRRYSYGSPSPLGHGLGGNERSILGVPNTPSPTAGRGATVGLNNKWLYEKGRTSSGGRSIYS